MNKFIDGLDNDAYHDGPEVGKTTLDMIHVDQYAIDWAGSCEVDKEKLKTLNFGDAMHAICLEPERLASEFVVMPEFNLRTNLGKDQKKEFDEANANKKIISSDEYKKLRLMLDSVMSHPQARMLLESEGACERSYYWKDEQTGIDCKCRPDKEVPQKGILVDIKTTDTLAKFCYSVEDYRYYVQDPFYRDGVSNFWPAEQMLFLVIQKSINCGRYPVSVVKLPDEAIMFGRQQYRKDLDKYKRFLDAGKPITDYKELAMHSRFMNDCVENLEVML